MRPALARTAVYGLRGRDVVELQIRSELAADPARRRSHATATERVICTLPESAITALNENSDGTRLAVGAAHAILGIDVTSGAVEEIHRVPDPNGYGGHVQWSHTNPHLLSFGQGEHPHVGWDRKGWQVAFTSHRLGNPDVCVATIPAAWQEANTTAANPRR